MSFSSLFSVSLSFINCPIGLDAVLRINRSQACGPIVMFWLAFYPAGVADR